MVKNIAIIAAVLIVLIVVGAYALLIAKNALTTATTRSSVISTTATTAQVIPAEGIGTVYCNTGPVTRNQTEGAMITFYSNGSTASVSTTGQKGSLTPNRCAVYNGRVYCFGGDDPAGLLVFNYTYYSSGFSPAGVGNWTQSTQVPSKLVACFVGGSKVYCFANLGPGKTENIYYANLSSNGVGPWIESAPYPGVNSTYECVTNSGHIYCLNPPNQSYYASISNSSGIGAWMQSAPFPRTFNGYTSCHAAANYVYCIGFKNDSSAVYYANLSDSGLSGWNTTSPFPNGSSALPPSCVAVNSTLFCQPVLSNKIYYAMASSSGGLSQWQSASAAHGMILGIMACT